LDDGEIEKMGWMFVVEEHLLSIEVAILIHHTEAVFLQ
jgi:hypothetical protein